MYTELWGKEFEKNTAFMERNQFMAVMEIGCFEGLTSNYIADQLLAWNGKLLCVDPLQSDYALDGDGSLFEGQFDRFIENTDYNKERITLIRDGSEKILQLFRDETFDFIYVDGHHTTNAVYFDCTQSFRILKTGGYLLVDDLNWGHNREIEKGVDQFLSETKNYKLLLRLNQLLIQKLPEESETEDGTDRYQELTVEKLFTKDTIHAAYTNLDERRDRDEKMIVELQRISLDIPIVRQRSFPWQELYNDYDDAQKEKVGVMIRRTPGALGCHLSQVAIMQEALKQGRHAWVNEDDLVFCDDMHQRLKIIFKFLNQHEWDIFWMGGTYHTEPTWHKSVEGKHTHPDMQMCKCILNRDWEETNNPHIVRTYGAFSTHSYLVNKDRIEHILNLLDTNLHLSMGIDWIMLKEQPNLFTYAFNPGCIKQYSSQSNIGDGISDQEGFRQLGQHWFSRKMKEYKPD